MMWRATLLLAVSLFLGALGRDHLDAWVAATDLPPLSADTSVEVHDRNGRLLRAYTVADGRWRLPVKLGQVDPGFVDMLIAYEDKRFYDHRGVDPKAMARALGQAIWNGEVVSGASTLTMQVARLLEDGGTGRLDGKLRQIRLALALERRLSKAEILTLYLNRAPYGGNLEGVRAATRAYFGKPPRRLTAAEAALLVALPQSPEMRRPDRHPHAAEDARNRVLARVSGSALARDEATAALREVVPSARRAFPKIAPHMADRALREAPLAARHTLTLDIDLQRSLEGLAREAVRAQGRALSVAILALDHTTGEVVASVGSAGYQGGQGQGFVDMTRAVRSPGSTLKPLVYGLAFDQGLAHPETLMEDKPTVFGAYAPQNFDGQYRGTVKVREALQMSLNIPVVALTEALGPARLMAHLERAGAAPKLSGAPGLAVALGGVGVTLEDLVRLYASLGQLGQPVGFQWRQGVAEAAGSNPVLSDVGAWHVGDILRGLAPPAGSARNGLAYKTGTSYGHRDAWAIGYDGRHVIGVWFGRPDGTPVPGVFGGDMAAPILFEAFGRLKPALDAAAPPPAATLMVETARLPKPLQKFRPRGAVFDVAEGAPVIAFPPDGARIDVEGGAFFARVREGEGPFTWLADGRPIVVGDRGRDAAIEGLGRGYVTLSVIDAKGRASRAAVFLE